MSEMRITNPVTLKDALHNLDVRSGANNDYCTGLAVGIVAALMATGFLFKDAIAQVAIHMPAETTKPRYTFPESWLQDVFAARITFEPTTSKE
jgi:hypothetical protein